MLPNFLIVGAAKSGTTSLYRYLNEHPEIYMPREIKETFFFTGKDFKDVNLESGNYGAAVITLLERYMSLFDEAEKGNFRVIGEACVGYLYYCKETIPKVKKYIPEANIIIILRNPIDRAYSNYMHHVRDGYEKYCFEDALRLETERKEKKWWWGYCLKEAGLYYSQVKAYWENFNCVKIYLYDDLKRDSISLVQDIYKFLGVDPNFVPDVTKKYNISGAQKNKWLHALLSKQNPLKSAFKPVLKVLMPEEKRRELIEHIKIKNLQKPCMKPETREYLKNFYREDIMKLQDLIQRDLSGWLN